MQRKPITPGDVKSTTSLETYKCELRQAYEKKRVVYAIFNKYVENLNDVKHPEPHQTSVPLKIIHKIEEIKKLQKKGQENS